MSVILVKWCTPRVYQLFGPLVNHWTKATSISVMSIEIPAPINYNNMKCIILTRIHSFNDIMLGQRHYFGGSRVFITSIHCKNGS